MLLSKVFILLTSVLGLFGGLTYTGLIANPLNSQTITEDVPYVTGIDFQRYSGVWYTIASLPNLIEAQCRCSQTLDTLAGPLEYILSQSCLIGPKNITSNSRAVATVAGAGNWTNVVGRRSAPYWVINLDKQNYSWSVIGQPTRKGFWILSRQPTLADDKLQYLINWGKSIGYDLSKLGKEDQSCHKSNSSNQVLRKE